MPRTQPTRCFAAPPVTFAQLCGKKQVQFSVVDFCLVTVSASHRCRGTFQVVSDLPGLVALAENVRDHRPQELQQQIERLQHQRDIASNGAKAELGGS